MPSQATVSADESRPASMSQITPVVFVVDDDVSVRESLELLLRFAGCESDSIRA